MKYIITWVVYITAQLDCPLGDYSCLVLHVRHDQKEMQNPFFNRDSAMVFYNSMVKESMPKFTLNDTIIFFNLEPQKYIGNVKIDSIKNATK